MSHVLIIEDSRTIALLLQAKLRQDYGIAADIAPTYAHAKNLLIQNRRHYFMALTDLNQPDAPNGEIIALLDDFRLPSIVLTASVSAELRHKVLSTYIIDYVIKRNLSELDNVTNLVNRLRLNQHIKAVVLESSPSFSKYLKYLLEMQQFNVFVTPDKELALKTITQDKSTQLVIVDTFEQPNEALEMVRILRDKYSRSEMVIIAVSSLEDQEYAVHMLKNGANDLVRKPFLVEELYCRLQQNMDALDYVRKIKNFAERDYLTQLYNRRYFFQQASLWLNQLQQTANSNLVAATFDIDHFKRINDTYGHDTGDCALQHFAAILQQYATTDNVLLARFGGEEFCLLIKNADDASNQTLLETIRLHLQDSPLYFKDHLIEITTSIGCSRCSDFSAQSSIEYLLSIADQKLYQAKNSGRNCLVL